MTELLAVMSLSMTLSMLSNVVSRRLRLRERFIEALERAAWEVL